MLCRLSMLRLSCRATFTSLPQDVVENIVKHLLGNDKVRSLPVPGPSQLEYWGNTGYECCRINMCVQVNLALSCKGMLPYLCMGHVSVRLDKPGQRPLTQLNRCLKKQPDGVSHLKLFSLTLLHSTRQLIHLRCAHVVQAFAHGAGYCMCLPWVCQSIDSQHTGRGPVLMLLCANAVCCQTCASCTWTASPFPCRRCSRSPRGCIAW